MENDSAVEKTRRQLMMSNALGMEVSKGGILGFVIHLPITENMLKQRKYINYTEFKYQLKIDELTNKFAHDF